MSEYGGAAGGSGYGFQSSAIAYVGCHILAGEPLHWFDSQVDTPKAVRTETGGPGDDLLVELANGRSIEVQAKAGLRKGKDLWKALKRLVEGLKAAPHLLGVLLVDDRASGTIRSNLATDLERLRGGETHKLDSITTEFLQHTSLDAKRDLGVLLRLRVISLHIEPGQPNRLVALTHLRLILANDTQAESALEMLTARSLRLIKIRGRMDIGAFQCRLRRRYPLETRGESPSAVRNRFLRWQAERMETFSVPGFVQFKLRMADDWIPRSAALQPASGTESSDMPEPKPIESALASFRPGIRLLASGPGDGKSLIGRRLAFWLAGRGRMVIHVRLRQVARKIAAGNTFSEAIQLTSTDGIDISNAAWNILLSEQFLLIADGIDECGTQVSDIAEGILNWHIGHPNAAVVVTGRPAGVDSVTSENWDRYDLAPFQSDDQDKFIRTLVKIAGGDVDADKICTAVKATLEDKRLAPFRPISPLMLGFVTRLVLDGIEPGHRRAELFGNLAKRMLQDRPHDSRPEPELEPSLRQFGYRAAGWHLLVHEANDGEALEKMVADVVPDKSGVERMRLAHQCMTVLEARGLLEPMGDSWTFIHDALAEHAAGLWLISDVVAVDQHRWVIANAEEERFRQIFLFAAGAATENDLVQSVLAAWDRSDAATTIPELAALMLVEMPSPDLHALHTILPELITRLQLPVSLLVDESARALRTLASRFPSEVAKAVQPIHDSNNQNTAWNAMAICLECGPEFVDLAQLKCVLSESSSTVSSPFMAKLDLQENRPRAKKTSLFMISREWEQQQAFVTQAIDLLLENDTSDSTVELVTQVAKGGGVSVNTLQHAMKCLKEKGRSDAAAELSSELMGENTLHFLKSLSRPHEEDLDLLLVFREACGKVKSNPIRHSSWNELSEIGSVLQHFEWGDQSRSSYAIPLNRNGFVNLVRAVLQASTADLTLLAGQLDWAIAEQRASLAHPDEPMSESIYSTMGSKPPALDWTKVKLPPAEMPLLVEALGHPCRAVSVKAVDAINGGILGDQTGDLCRAFMTQPGARASIAAFVNQSALGFCPIQLLCDLLPQPIPETDWPLFAAIEQLGEERFDEQMVEVLLRASRSTSSIATSATRSLLKCDATVVRTHISAFRSTFDWWKGRDDTRPDYIIPNSPRAVLVDLLWQLDAFELADLLALAEDHRNDVSDHAIKHLSQFLDSHPQRLGPFLLENRNSAGTSRLLVELDRMASAALEKASSLILELASDAHPEVQVAALRQLRFLNPPTDQAITVLHKACGSDDLVVRTTAVGTARALHISIPPSLLA